MLEPKLLWTIIHLFGVALGAGSAFFSDAMFFHTVRDKKINKTEFGFLKLGSRLVWLGLIVLLVSGIGIWSLDPAGYSQSTKFLLKMIIVFVITFNGLFFHRVHFGRLKRSLGMRLSEKSSLIRHRTSVVASGAISVWSWSLAIILGSLPNLPLSLPEALLVYTLSTAMVVVVAIQFQDKIIRI